MASVKLQHVSHKLPIKFEFMYDGQVVAYDGVAELKPDELRWARPLYYKGYQNRPDGTWMATQMDMEAEIARQLSQTDGTDDGPKGNFPRKPIQTATRVRAGSKNKTESEPITTA